MIIGYLGSPKNSVFNNENLTSLPRTVPELFNLQPTAFYFEMDSNLIAMTRKNTNLYETIKNQRSFLPRRMLLESDREKQANDLPELVNKSLDFLFSFRFDWLSFIEKIWEKLTCNYEGRIYAQHTLESMATSKFLAFKYLIQATINACLFQCDHSFKNDL